MGGKIIYMKNENVETYIYQVFIITYTYQLVTVYITEGKIFQVCLLTLSLYSWLLAIWCDIRKWNAKYKYWYWRGIEIPSSCSVTSVCTTQSSFLPNVYFGYTITIYRKKDKF